MHSLFLQLRPWALGVGLIFCAFTRPAGAAEYYLEDLGTLGGRSSMALAINQAGQVAGATTDPTGRQMGFLWTDGVLQRLSYLGSDLLTAINNANPVQVAGWTNPTGLGAAFWLNTRGQSVQLPTPQGLKPNRAYGINDRGEVVGSFQLNAARQTHAFLWTFADARRPESGFVIRDLGTLGGQESEALAINNSGQIAGYAATERGEWRACLWEGGRPRDLGTLGGRESRAYAINASGQMAGVSTTADAELRAFLWKEGGMRDLGPLPRGMRSVAYGINDAGHVVGTLSPLWFSTQERAFLWTPQAGLVDLNTPQFQALGWRLQQARGINNRGQIVGWGTRGGQQRAFRLSPLSP